MGGGLNAYLAAKPAGPSSSFHACLRCSASEGNRVARNPANINPGVGPDLKPTRQQPLHHIHLGPAIALAWCGFVSDERRCRQSARAFTHRKPLAIRSG